MRVTAAGGVCSPMVGPPVGGTRGGPAPLQTTGLFQPSGAKLGGSDYPVVPKRVSAERQPRRPPLPAGGVLWGEKDGSVGT